MFEERSERFKLPKHAEKYVEIDFKTLPGERVEEIVPMSPLSKIRSYVLCTLLAVFGYTLYALFSEEITAQTLVPPAAVFLAAYFVWNLRTTRDLKHLFFSVIKYAVHLILLSYALAFFASMFSPLISASRQLFPGLPEEGFKFSANPVENIQGMLSFTSGLMNAFLMPHAPLIRLVSLCFIVCCAVAAVLVYLSCRGQLYYVTDRRIIVRRKFGTVQVTTLPLDGLVEVIAFQGFFGRLLGYGDIVLSMVSGSGVAESLRPQPAQPVGSFYEVKRKLEGVRDVWALKDAIIMLRDKYVEARYLERIEGELKRIREAVEEKEKPPWVRASEEKKYIA